MTTNLNILVISYHFPPEGGPAVQRVTKFVKYLSAMGITCTVLTAGNISGIKDPELLAEIPADVEVIRTMDAGRYVPGELRRLFRRVFVPDKMALWKFTAFGRGKRLVRKKNIDLIFSTSPPHSVQLVARAIAQACNLPWIADFRDEWTMNPTFAKACRQGVQQLQEKMVLERADRVVTVTRSARDNFSRFLPDNKLSLIENGYDGEDFAALPEVSTDNRKLKIAYAGRLNELHDPTSFFAALKDLIQHLPADEKSLLQVQIFGSMENKKWLKNFPDLQGIVRFNGYLPHARVISELASASVLLLLATNMAHTEFIPAKVYEYFKLKKRILAIVSYRGELSELLEQYGNSRVCLQSDVAGIRSELYDLLDRFKKNDAGEALNEDLVARYDRKILSAKLAGLMQQTTKEFISKMSERQ